MNTKAKEMEGVQTYCMHCWLVQIYNNKKCKENFPKGLQNIPSKFSHNTQLNAVNIGPLVEQ